MKRSHISFLFIFFLINIFFAVHNDVYINNEHSGYWYFNKILVSEFLFADLSRSFLYTIYISLFNWLQFPYNMIVDATVTNTITCFSVYLLFKDKLNFTFIILVIFFSLGFIYNQVPYPQAMAFAFSNFAVYFKKKNYNQYLVYVLLICAVYFRITYIIVFFAFLFIDLLKLLINKNENRLKNFTNIFIILVIFLLSSEIVNNNSSSSKYNNGYFNSLKWSPTKSNSNVDIAFILNYNYLYIEKNYKNIEKNKRDYYFTNKKLFNGAQTIKDALFSNPKFFFWGVTKNSLHIPAIIINKFQLRNLLPDCKNGHSCLSNYIFISIGSVLFLLTIYFYFLRKYFKKKKLSKILNDDYLIYAISNFVLIFITVLAMPKIRYMLPFIFFIIPMIIVFRNLIKKKIKNLILINIFTITLIFSFSFFSYNLTFLKNFYSNFQNGIYFKIFKKYNDDINKINNELKFCPSILVDSPTFILAFTNYDEDKVRTFSEIPPFGKYKKNNKFSLSDNINIKCILLNESLISSMGSNRGVGPNYDFRRENYLYPFLESNKEYLIKKTKFNLLGELLIYNN